jgi:DNA-directed RNA polymerase subunit RPC12/RpoP
MQMLNIEEPSSKMHEYTCLGGKQSLIMKPQINFCPNCGKRMVFQTKRTLLCKRCGTINENKRMETNSSQLLTNFKQLRHHRT